MVEFIDEGLRVRAIDGSTKHYIREDGVKLTKRKDGSFGYRKGSIRKSGYVTINLGGKNLKMHRVVALAFIPNPKNLPYVDHIDNNSTNNNVRNLRWCTPAQNVKYYNAGQPNLNKNASNAVVNALHKNITTLQSKLSTSEVVLANSVIRNTYLLAALKDVLLGNPIDPTLLASVQIGNTLIIDGKIFGGTGTAARYIVEREDSIGNTRNHATVNKELRKYQRGLRPQWEMYGKYTIGY